MCDNSFLFDNHISIRATGPCYILKFDDFSLRFVIDNNMNENFIISHSCETREKSSYFTAIVSHIGSLDSNAFTTFVGFLPIDSADKTAYKRIPKKSEIHQ